MHLGPAQSARGVGGAAAQKAAVLQGAAAPAGARFGRAAAHLKQASTASSPPWTAASSYSRWQAAMSSGSVTGSPALSMASSACKVRARRLHWLGCSGRHGELARSQDRTGSCARLANRPPSGTLKCKKGLEGDAIKRLSRRERGAGRQQPLAVQPGSSSGNSSASAGLCTPGISRDTSALVLEADTDLV